MLADAKNISPREISKSYDEIYSTHGLRAPSRYYRWIISLLRIKGARVLDVACGEGILLRELKRQNPSVEAFGFDISYTAARISCTNADRASILAADGQYIPFKDGSFDHIFCLGSLEHFNDPTLGLREMRRVLNSSGTICIVVPNISAHDKSDEFQVIERHATKDQWRILFEACNMTVQGVYGSNPFPEFFAEGTIKIKSIIKFVKRVIHNWFCPLNMAREFVFICKKQ